VENELRKIKILAEKKEIENWEFRIFLKNLDMSIEELDAVVHEIYEKVVSEIDCTKCANCCKEIKSELDNEDVEKLSINLDVTTEELISQYLIESEEPGKWNFNKLPCPFLIDNLCSKYNHRPKACFSYPHLHKKQFVFRLWSVIENYSICPIVFNVYENLKAELW